MTTGKAFLLTVALSLFCGTCTAQWAGGAGTQPAQLIEPNPNSCECSDANPRDGVYYNVTYTCLQQLNFGSCNEEFIRNSVKELSEGYCEITCGRCSCCKSVADVLQSNNANTLIQAAQLAGMDKQLASPASMFTLLAPTNDAFTAALRELDVEDLASVPPASMEAILGYHIIPPHKYIDAVWTTPFFEASDGAEIDTALPGSPLTFSSSGGKMKVKGASNSATIVTADVEACKSFINIIDTVLMPPADAKAAPLSANAGSITAYSGGPAPSNAKPAAAAPAAEVKTPTADSTNPTVAAPEAGTGLTATPIGATAGR